MRATRWRPQRRRAASGRRRRSHERAAVFLRAAELLATTWRATLNAATMLGQSKTVFQAEIDAASELIDFWRFNPAFAQSSTPSSRSAPTRPVEPDGLPAARGLRLCGDAVQFHVDRRQPADRTGADGQHRRLEAGGKRRSSAATTSCGCSRRPACRQASSTSCPATRVAVSEIAARRRPDLAGIHFTGSTAVFQGHVEEGRRQHWAATGPTRDSSVKRAARTSSWRTRPPTSRSSRWPLRAAASSIQGQKCSAASRVYVPRSLWRDVRERGRRDDARDADGRRLRLPHLHRRGHRPQGASRGSAGYLDDARRNATIVQGGGAQRRPRLLRRADARRDRRPAVPAACARRFSDRSSPRSSIPTREWEDTLRLVDSHVALRA